MNDILNADGDFLNERELFDKYRINTHFLEVLQIRQSLPYSWRNIIRSITPYKIHVHGDSELYVYDMKMIKPLSKCTTKMLYLKIVNQNAIKPNCISKWQIVYPNTTNEEL